MDDARDFHQWRETALPGSSEGHTLTYSPGNTADTVEQELTVDLLTEPATLGIAAAIYLLLQIGGVLAAVHAVFNAVAYFELCATRDAGSDVVARMVTRPVIAAGLAGVLLCGWWLLPRRTSIEAAPPGSEAGGDAARPWTSGAPDHL